MSLFGAMNTAISGLTAQSAAFGNIGDNVANSQTVGFKRIDTTFQDYLTTSSASTNQPGAVVSRPDYANTVQGTVTQTDNPLDLAIAGQGFFVVSRPVGEDRNNPIFRVQQDYTRAGDFAMNKNGYIVNGSGDYLNAWLTDPSTGLLDTTAARPIVIGQAGYSPVATGNATLSANLPASPDGTPIKAQMPITDALGRSQTLDMSWTPAAANVWTLTISQGGSTTPLGTATIAFGTVGNPAAPQGTVGSAVGTGGITGSTFAEGAACTLKIAADFGAGPQPITLNLGHFGKSDGLTQFAGTTYSPRALTQDGVAPGSFNGVTMRPNGDVVINYDNGQSRVAGRVPIVTFANPDGLQRENGQAFSATRDSGAPQIIQAGSNGAGQLVANAVEGSNVDIAKEFTKLIVAQRAYSANTKLVTTADELLQSTLDMKR
jgi:flagellar hook protein FlgE